MIVSKASLQVVELTKTDKNIPLLDTVHIAVDGTVIASNGKGVIAVSPVPAVVSESVPANGIDLPVGTVAGVGVGGVTMGSDFVKELLRSIPADKLFKGLLEFVRIGMKGNAVVGVVTDGKREKSLSGRTVNIGEYVPFRDIFKRFFTARVGSQVILDAARLKVMLDVVCKVCPDSGGVLPVYIEFTDAGGIILRADNAATGQRVVSVLSSADGSWLESDRWERSLTGTTIGKRRKGGNT